MESGWVCNTHVAPSALGGVGRSSAVDALIVRSLAGNLGAGGEMRAEMVESHCASCCALDSHLGGPTGTHESAFGGRGLTDVSLLRALVVDQPPTGNAEIPRVLSTALRIGAYPKTTLAWLIAPGVEMRALPGRNSICALLLGARHGPLATIAAPCPDPPRPSARPSSSRSGRFSPFSDAYFCFHLWVPPEGLRMGRGSVP